MKWGWNEE